MACCSFFKNKSKKGIDLWVSKQICFSLQLPIFSLFLVFWPCCKACGILVPWPGIEPTPLALEAWSLNHWTPGKSPSFSFKSSNGWKQWTHNVTSSTWHQSVLNLPWAPQASRTPLKLKDWKGSIKVFLFSDDIIVYVENPMESTKKTNKLLNQ